MSKATSLSRTPGGNALELLGFFFFLCSGFALGAPNESVCCPDDGSGGGCDEDDVDDVVAIEDVELNNCCCDERAAVVEVETSISPEFAGSGIGTWLLQRLCTQYLHSTYKNR